MPSKKTPEINRARLIDPGSPPALQALSAWPIDSGTPVAAVAG